MEFVTPLSPVFSKTVKTTSFATRTVEQLFSHTLPLASSSRTGSNNSSHSGRTNVSRGGSRYLYGLPTDPVATLCAYTPYNHPVTPYREQYREKKPFFAQASPRLAKEKTHREPYELHAVSEQQDSAAFQRKGGDIRLFRNALRTPPPLHPHWAIGPDVGVPMGKTQPVLKADYADYLKYTFHLPREAALAQHKGKPDKSLSQSRTARTHASHGRHTIF